MYAYYRDLISSTTVDHAVALHFSSATTRDLVISRSNYLEVYSVNLESREFERDDGKKTLPEDHPEAFFTEELLFPSLKKRIVTTKSATLRLLLRSRFHGMVQALGVIRTPASRLRTLDQVVVGFGNMKVAILEFDPSTISFKTLSIHWYGRAIDLDLSIGWTGSSEIRVDPGNRCIVRRLCQDQLAILPMKARAEAIYDHPTGDSFILNLRNLREGVRNVQDFAFLNNYYEPTMAILCEPTQTWTGRLAIHRDSFSVAVVSLDLHQRLYPVLYEYHNIPSSSQQIIPVPVPVGGLIVIGASFLMYMDQTTRSGVAINALSTFETSESPDRDCSHLNIDAFNSQAAFLTSHTGPGSASSRTPPLLIGCTNGDYWMVDIGSKSFDGFAFKQVAADSVVPSCLAPLEDSFLFIGSRLGDPLLVRWVAAINDQEASPSRDIVEMETDLYGRYNTDRGCLDPPRPHVIGDASSGAPDVLQTPSLSRIRKLGNHFIVCDDLLNIAPMQDFCVAEIPDLRVGEYASPLELVTIAGNRSSGAVCKLQREIKPVKLISTDGLDGVIAVWAVKATRELLLELRRRKGDSSLLDALSTVDGVDHCIVVSRDRDTLIFLATEKGFNLVERGDFYRDGPTLAITAVLKSTRIVQVYAYGIRVLDGFGKIAQEVPLRSKGIYATIVDKFICVVLEDHSLVGYKINRVTKTIVAMGQRNDQVEDCMHVCIFKDTCGLFAESTGDISEKDVVDGKRTGAGLPSRPNTSPTAELDEADLYATAEPRVKGREVTVTEENVSGIPESERAQTLWCMVVKSNASVEIRSFPHFDVVWENNEVGTLPTLLQDTRGQDANTLKQTKPHDILEVSLFTMGFNRDDVYLTVKTVSGLVLLYQAFRYEPTQESPFDLRNGLGRLPLRFAQVQVDHTALWIGRTFAPTWRNFVPFESIGAGRQSGVICLGNAPALITADRHHAPHAYPLPLEEPLVDFAQFHHPVCKHGFVYVTVHGRLQAAALSEATILEGDWPVVRKQLRKSVHFVAFHEPSGKYTITTSETIKFMVDEEQGDEENVGEHANPPAESLLPDTEKFNLTLLDPQTLTEIDEIDFEPDEHILSNRSVTLLSKQTESGRKPFIIVGTSFVTGEDHPTKGKVYVFDVASIVPPPGYPAKNAKLKQLTSEEVKGPVSALASINNQLLVAAGAKIIVFNLENDTLIGTAFLDVNSFVTSIATLRNYILVGDVFKSIWLVVYQLEPPKLALLSKDYEPLDVQAAEFMVEDASMGLVASDSAGNLLLFKYNPLAAQSYSGHRVLELGDFHVGSVVSKFLRFGGFRHQFLLCSNLDGGFGLLCPIDEKLYRRLFLLINRMSVGIAHGAALHPKTFRLPNYRNRHVTTHRRNVVDGSVLAQFPHLPLRTQEAFTHSYGANPDQILADLDYIQRLTQVF